MFISGFAIYFLDFGYVDNQTNMSNIHVIDNK